MTTPLPHRGAVLLAAIAAVLFAAAPAVTSPPAQASPGQNCAAGYMADPNSGNCWQMQGAGSPTVGGGPCLPGRVGTCVGYLANNPMSPGDMLPDTSTTAAPSKSATSSVPITW